MILQCLRDMLIWINITESPTEKEKEDMPKQTRSVRTKRVRPDFFNPLDIEYSTKKFRTKSESKEVRNCWAVAGYLGVQYR